MSENPPHDPAWETTPAEVAEKLKRGGDGFVLLDCRTAQEHGYARIPGAVLVPMQGLGEHLPMLREHEDDEIVVMCRSGHRSLMVARVLREQGFSNVRSMAGGILRWSAEIDPTVPTY